MNGDGSSRTFDYHFDGAGNRTDLGPVNNLDQYTNFTYDTRGNLIDDTVSIYSYDPMDRLISVTPKSPSAGSVKVTMGYDSQDRRIWKKTFAWDASLNGGAGDWSSTPQQYLEFAYDGMNLVAEFSSDGTTDTLLRSYAWGQSLGGGIGGLLSITDYNGATPKTYLPFYDGNGNVTGLTDAADGSVAATYEYDPFGNLTASSGPAANVNPFRFSTKYFDSETGLYNFGYRFYSPAQGRFITRDPSGEFNGGANLYAFVGNDPLNGIDPQGLAEIRYKGPFIRRDPANENVSQIYYIQSTWDTPSRDYRPHPWDWEIGTSSIGIGVTAVARLKPIMIDMQIISRPIYGLWGQKADPASITKSVHDKPDGEVAGIIDNTLMELRTQLAIAENTREYASFTRDAFLQTAFMSTVAGGMQLKSALDDANMGVGGVGEPTPEYVSRRQDHSGKANGYVKQANRSPSPLKYDIAAHPNDVDLRGQDIGFQKALEQAFENTTVPRSQFQVSKWAKTIYGKTIPVEWTGPGGAEVSIDEAHVDRNWTLDKKWASGPDAPHIGWQRPGNNRKVGIGARGHIIVDSVPAGRQGAF